MNLLRVLLGGASALKIEKLVDVLLERLRAGKATLIKPMIYLFAPEAVRAKMRDMVHISMIGLFTVLLIFVLAQIFRRGSEMRAELAGTI